MDTKRLSRRRQRNAIAERPARKLLSVQAWHPASEPSLCFDLAVANEHEIQTKVSLESFKIKRYDVTQPRASGSSENFESQSRRKLTNVSAGKTY